MAYSARAEAYRKSGQYEKAIADYNKLIAHSPQYLGYYLLRASAFGQLGQCEKALADCNKVVASNPMNIGAYVARAGIYGVQLKQYNKAVEDYKRR